MQTFLPYPDFQASAKCLDYKRLGKQRVEAYQILRALSGQSKGWVNHPATKMWRGYEVALAKYGAEMCKEWKARGYKDSLFYKFADYLVGHIDRDTLTFQLPPWVGGSIHASHRSNLLRKDKKFYGKYGWVESDDLPYVWPIQ